MKILPANSFYLITVCLVFLTAPSNACNVPVFRYALERWPADPYQFTLFFNDSTQIRQIDNMLRSSDLNAEVRLVDLSLISNSAVPETIPRQPLPWMTIEFPRTAPVQGILWQAHADSATVERIITCEVRKTIGESILAGDAVVWILLKSGQQEKDARAQEELGAALKTAKQKLEIPSMGLDVDGKPIPVTDFQDYELRFGLVEIDPDQATDDILARILRTSEPDLTSIEEPMAFPVFGRGRALYALVGKGINRQNILESCQSIIGWCSCEVKALNPGLDLLMDVDWSNPAGGRMVDTDIGTSLTGLEGFMDSDTAQNHAYKKNPDPANPGSAMNNRPIWRNLFILIGVIVIGIGTITYRIQRRQE